MRRGFSGEWRGFSWLFTFLLDFLRSSQLNPPAFDSLYEFQSTAHERLGIATSNLMRGFAWIEAGIDFVTETELFATTGTTRRRKKQEQVSDVEALIKDLSELKVGDPVVHSQHGIGRYRGLIHMDLGEKNADGSPVKGAKLELELGGVKIPVEAHAEGEFEATLVQELKPGVVSVAATVIAGEETDLLAGELDMHEEAHAEEATHTHGWKEYALWAAIAGGALFVLAALLRRLRASRNQRFGGAA